MPAIETKVLDYLINPPHQQFPPWQSILAKGMYAVITCQCESGMWFSLYFLRPDTEWPGDPGSSRQNVYDSANSVATAFLTASEYARHLAMLEGRDELTAYLDSDYPQANRLCVKSTPAAPRVGFQPVPDLDAWLVANPQISGGILWPPTYALYPQWPQAQKDELLAAFQDAWNGTPMQLPDPPQPVTAGPGDFAAVFISTDDAWHLYIAHLAFMLAAELGHWLPWTLLDYGQDQYDQRLSILFHHAAICGVPHGTHEYTISSTMPAPPQVAYGFLASRGLIGQDRRETIARVLGWCRDKLTHFDDKRGVINDLAHWQYPIPAVSRILSGTVCSTSPQRGLQHYTAGCIGTMEFLQALLRCVNIPVAYASVDGHTSMHFLSEDTYLCHGDDPYSSPMKATPEIPTGELPISRATYDSWFANEADVATRCANVTRRCSELMIKHLPDVLLHKRYLDKKAGVGVSADSAVYKLFTIECGDLGTQSPYDVSTLENGSITMADGTQFQCDLWSRIDAKTAAFGSALFKQQHPYP